MVFQAVLYRPRFTIPSQGQSFLSQTHHICAGRQRNVALTSCRGCASRRVGAAFNTLTD